MTRGELVKAAIRHQPAERVPYYVRLTGEMEQVVRERVGDDVDGFLDNDVVGLTPPWWHWHHLAADWAEFDPPVSRANVRGSGGYESFADEAKRAKDETGKYMLAVIWGSHFEKAYFARGIETFLADMAGEPEFATRFLREIVDRNMVMLDNFVTLPEIDGVLLGSDWGSQRGLLMSLESWDAMIRPGEQREYDLIHAYGKDVWVHSCGDVAPLLSRLVEMGVDVLNPVQPECMDIAALKRDFGERITFWGGISTQQILPFGTPEQVFGESLRVRDMMSSGGGYITAPAQEIQNDVPFENLLALLRAARAPKTNNQQP